MKLSAVAAVLPDRAGEVKRMERLDDPTLSPVVTVLGKYNHGKSTLLNTLIGDDVFAVSDARQTTTLDELNRDGVRWLDAPGLDADIDLHDDELARRGAWEEADVRLFVHSAAEGELDQSEMDVLDALREDRDRSGRTVLVVVTQIHAVEEEPLTQVLDDIREQAATFDVFPVSASRYQQSKEGGKPLLLAKSGFPALLTALRAAIDEVDSTRGDEMKALSTILFDELEQVRRDKQTQLDTLLEERQSNVELFERTFKERYAVIHHKINEA